jgi:hypothetical protein
MSTPSSKGRWELATETPVKFESTLDGRHFGDLEATQNELNRLQTIVDDTAYRVRRSLRDQIAKELRILQAERRWMRSQKDQEGIDWSFYPHAMAALSDFAQAFPKISPTELAHHQARLANFPSPA